MTPFLCASWGFGTFTEAATFYVNNTGTCSDSNAGTSSGAPLCTISSGRSKSSAGDTINVTPGTYPMTGSLDLSKSNQTWQRSNTSGYAILDYGNSLAVGAWFHAPGCTVDGFRFTNFRVTEDTTAQRNYVIGTDPVLGITIKNNWLDVREGTTNGQPGCASCTGGINLTGGRFLIENNEFHGGGCVAIAPANTYQIYNGQAAGYDPADAGGTIRNNHIYLEGSNGGSTSQVGMVFETIGRWDKHSTWLVYNNTITSTFQHSTRSWAFYLREIAVTMRMWNNYGYNVNTAFYLQEAFSTCLNQGPSGSKSCASEDLKIFNNTMSAGATVQAGADAVLWNACIDAEFKNNIFMNFGYGFHWGGQGNPCTSASPPSDASSRGGPQDSPGGGSISNNLMYRVTNPNALTHFVYRNSSNVLVDVNTSSPQFPELGPFSANVLNVSPNLNAGGNLQAGSPAIDVGTGNPISLGTNTCSVSDGTQTVSCLPDYIGTIRPVNTTWDIGWNEFGGTAPPATGTMVFRGAALSGVH